MRPCSILIPTYNGKKIMEVCLPGVMRTVEIRGGIDEIIILDNASSDGTSEWLRETCPAARVMTLEENKAIFALNDGAAAARHPLVCFLNNDIAVDDDFLTPLVEPFEAPDVFAVTGRVMQWDTGEVQAARRRGAFSRGRFYYWPARADEIAGATLYALGGQSVFDRDKFLELGGLDALFRPFYHEDLDLSWRAWRRGWRILYEPRSVMRHMGAATAKSFYSQRQILTMMQKHLFLFIWKNIHDPALAASHVLWLPARLLQALLTGESVFWRGFLAALPRLPEALRRRKAARESATTTDAHILGILRDI